MLTPKDIRWQFTRKLWDYRSYGKEFVVITAEFQREHPEMSPLDFGEDFVDRRTAEKRAKVGDKIDCYLRERGSCGWLAGNVVFTITDEKAPPSQPRRPRGTAPKRYNKYCGPFAVGYVTGTNPNVAAKMFRDLTGRRSIKGVYNSEMQRVLQRECQIENEWAYNTKEVRPTLAAWLRQHPRGLYVVCVTGHYVVVDGRKIYDNTHPGGVPAKDWRKRRVRVRRAWKLARS